jgi:hypothetical protein
MTLRPIKTGLRLLRTRIRCQHGFRPRLVALDDRCLPSLSPATSFPVGPNPQAVVTADVNGDGRLDLATANSSGGTVSVRLGNALGGFGAASHFATGASPRAMAVGDFDNDGKLDLATLGFAVGANYYADAVSALLGNGDGTFRAPVHTIIHGGSLAVAAGDFNADGKSDLIYTIADPIDWDNPIVVVLLAEGLGGFAHSSYYELNGTWSPVGLAVGDLNADGTPDVVTANEDAGAVSVLLGSGDGTLGLASNFGTGPSPRAVAVGDFTGDGVPDLITAGQTVDVLPGNGDGTVAAPIRHSANGMGMTAVTVADFNGDGRLDAVATDPGAGTVSVLLGRGGGTLSAPLDHAAGATPTAVAVGDFNGDRRPDVAATAAGSNAVAVLLNDAAWPPLNTPWLRIIDATVIEGNTGSRAATFTITLSAASAQTITVAYTTGNGTAAAGSDYQATAGTLTFVPGQTEKTVTVQVTGDRLAEANESLVVNLSGATNAVVVDSQGVGTVLDDEPRVSISDVSKAEGKKNQTTLFVFTVTLSTAYDQPVTMSFRTVDGTAKISDSDHVAKTGTLTFAPGETTKTVTIEVKGDNKREANETFYLDLFDTSGTVVFTRGRGIGTILNDD